MSCFIYGTSEIWYSINDFKLVFDTFCVSYLFCLRNVDSLSRMILFV